MYIIKSEYVQIWDTFKCMFVKFLWCKMSLLIRVTNITAVDTEINRQEEKMNYS